MATTTVSYAVPKFLIPLQGPGTAIQALTAIPQRAVIYEGTVDVPADGNQQQIEVSFYLPDNAVYLVSDFETTVEAQSVGDLNRFDSVSLLNVRYIDQANQVRTHKVACNSWNAITGNATPYDHARSYVPERLPSYPIQPAGELEAASQQIQWIILSGSAIASDIEVHAFARFLAYDKQQFENFPLHTPSVAIR